MSIRYKTVFKKPAYRTLRTLLLLFSFSPIGLAAEEEANISGTVRDKSGAVVAIATVTLLNAQQTIIGTTETDAFQHSGIRSLEFT